MNEEEINKLYNLCIHKGNNEEYEALRKLLDLYNKEKEKNIELEQELAKREWVKIKDNGEVEPLFYISKDKIREKIKEIINNSSRFNCISPLNWNEEYYKTRFAVDKLQELLQEGEVDE